MPSGKFPRTPVFEAPNLNNDHDSCIQHVVPCGHRCEKVSIERHISMQPVAAWQHVGHVLAVRTCASELELACRVGKTGIQVNLKWWRTRGPGLDSEPSQSGYLSLLTLLQRTLWGSCRQGQVVFNIHFGSTFPRARKVVWSGRCRSTRCRWSMINNPMRVAWKQAGLACGIVFVFVFASDSRTSWDNKVFDFPSIFDTIYFWHAKQYTSRYRRLHQFRPFYYPLPNHFVCSVSTSSSNDWVQ